MCLQVKNKYLSGLSHNFISNQIPLKTLYFACMKTFSFSKVTTLINKKVFVEQTYDTLNAKFVTHPNPFLANIIKIKIF